MNLCIEHKYSNTVIQEESFFEQVPLSSSVTDLTQKDPSRSQEGDS